MRGFGLHFVEGWGAARCLRQKQRGRAGAAVAECKRRPKARRRMREPQPVLQRGK